MDTTFITIHDLSPEARILYCSDSIVDILGYSPDQVHERSCWEYFHPDELPVARAKHGRGVELDKAAVISYCRMRDSQGQWVGCEVVFTIVYDVMVGCTSIYLQGLKSAKRAMEAPAIRRLFSNNPRDPRYHMLSHLSTKFILPPRPESHEPRAALFLNRYTRTLTIMYATNGLSDILGITGEQLTGKSFYYCIEKGCLKDAIRCLEDAKTNDSIAYLRFWYRDPRTDEQGEFHPDPVPPSSDDDMEDVQSSDADQATPSSSGPPHSSRVPSQPLLTPENTDSERLSAPAFTDSRASSDESSNTRSRSSVFSNSAPARSSASSVSTPAAESPNRSALELEAVVSCTSDGMVVCLRRAAPLPPPLPAAPTLPGSFFSPWTADPAPTAPQHLAAAPQQPPPGPTAAAVSTPPFMDAIRDCAVFAWALAGINGSLAFYAHGRPRGEATPPAGLPVWSDDKSAAGSGGRGGAWLHQRPNGGL